MFILDKSGSMGSVHQSTIDGFNQYVSKLKEENDADYRFSLTLFDTSVTKKYSNVPLSEVERLHADNYRPDGGTALYDAVCETLMNTESSGEKTLVVIMTDGEENSSRTHNENDFRNFVKLLKNTGRVSFVFLGANQDAWGNAQKWGFEKQNVAQYFSTSAGTQKAFEVVARGTSAFAMSASNSTADFFSKNDQDELKSSQ